MLENSAKFDFSDLVVIFRQENLRNITQNDFFIGIGTDTRKPIYGGIFIPLKGENTDGHSKISEALANGFGAALCSRSYFESNPELSGLKIIIAEDTVTALGDLAAHHRRRFQLPIIAVAGSNGKTSTKEMIATLLSKKFKVLKTHANFNNLIGVPLMLFQLSEEYNMAVLELGTNSPGEIYRLGEIVKPTHAIITNIGKEHLEQLLDLDGVEMEETSLLAHVMPGGAIFINRDDDRLKFYGHVIDNFITYSSLEDDAQVYGKIDLNDKLIPALRLKYDERDVVINLNTFGYESALNALASAAIGFHFELSDDEIKNGLESFLPVDGKGYARMKAFNHNGITIINDCYNANPSSVISALSNLKMLDINGKKIGVLGDMLELGEAEENEHIKALECASSICDHLFLYGPRFSAAAESVQKNNVSWYNDKTILSGDLIDFATKNDAILFKGSRGMKIEDIIEIFTQA